jgi:predicted nucleic acid-binding protein
MAEQGKLLIAVVQATTSQTYAGHLLFGGAYPRIRIFQIYVDPPHRRQGIGSKLVQALVRRTQADHYLSVSAKVAQDLPEANAFYERARFRIVQTKAGGAARGRLINIRVRELDTPTLLDPFTARTHTSDADLRLVERLSVRTAPYVIDLNVLFDVIKRRLRSEEAGRVIAAGLDNLVRLAVTDEFVGELRRASHFAVTDPVLELALRLPRLAQPPRPDIDRLCSTLGLSIFPERAALGRLSTQDQSDLVHIATAVYHRASGFITSDLAILRAGDRLLD